jgi:hypothetical protein
MRVENIPAVLSSLRMGQTFRITHCYVTLTLVKTNATQLTPLYRLLWTLLTYVLHEENARHAIVALL